MRNGGLRDGVPALKAELGPADVAVDGPGNVVESDGLSDRVRVVAATTGTFYGQQGTPLVPRSQAPTG